MSVSPLKVEVDAEIKGQWFIVEAFVKYSWLDDKRYQEYFAIDRVLLFKNGTSSEVTSDNPLYKKNRDSFIEFLRCQWHADLSKMADIQADNQKYR